MAREWPHQLAARRARGAFRPSADDASRGRRIARRRQGSLGPARSSRRRGQGSLFRRPLPWRDTGWRAAAAARQRIASPTRAYFARQRHMAAACDARRAKRAEDSSGRSRSTPAAGAAHGGRCEVAIIGPGCTGATGVSATAAVPGSTGARAAQCHSCATTAIFGCLAVGVEVVAGRRTGLQCHRDGAASDNEHQQLAQPEGELPIGRVRGEAVGEVGEAPVELQWRPPRPLASGEAARVRVDMEAKAKGPD
eukprot:scaffold41073_cov63-Phaeocystis_antarctica.AAC.4